MSIGALVVAGTYGESGIYGEERKSSEVCESNGDSGAANEYCIVLCEFYFIELILATTCA